MDYIREIERLQKEQEARLRLGIPQEPAHYVELKEAAVAQATAAARGEEAPARARPRPAAAPRAASQQGGSGGATGTTAHSEVLSRGAANVLIVPAIFLLVFALGNIEQAWTGSHVLPMEAAVVAILLIAFLAVLRVRRHLLRVARPGRGGPPPRRTADVVAGGVRTVFVLGVMLTIAGVILEEMFPQGLPVLEWWRDFEAAGGWASLAG